MYLFYFYFKHPPLVHHFGIFFRLVFVDRFRNVIPWFFIPEIQPSWTLDKWQVSIREAGKFYSFKVNHFLNKVSVKFFFFFFFILEITKFNSRELKINDKFIFEKSANLGLSGRSFSEQCVLKTRFIKFYWTWTWLHDIRIHFSRLILHRWYNSVLQGGRGWAICTIYWQQITLQKSI